MLPAFAGTCPRKTAGPTQLVFWERVGFDTTAQEHQIPLPVREGSGRRTEPRRALKRSAGLCPGCRGSKCCSLEVQEPMQESHL